MSLSTLNPSQFSQSFEVQRSNQPLTLSLGRSPSGQPLGRVTPPSGLKVRPRSLHHPLAGRSFCPWAHFASFRIRFTAICLTLACLFCCPSNLGNHSCLFLLSLVFWQLWEVFGCLIPFLLSPGFWGSPGRAKECFEFLKGPLPPLSSWSRTSVFGMPTGLEKVINALRAQALKDAIQISMKIWVDHL